MNTLSIIFIFVVLAIAIWIKSGWRPSMPNLPSLKIKSGWSLWGFLWKTMALAMVLMVLLMLGSCTACTWAKYKQATSSPEKVGTRALVPRFDGFTPCAPTFDYPFELDTQGDPITMDIPGIGRVQYSGKGKLDLGERKEKRTPGPVPIISDNPRKQARVRIWEVVYVNQ